MNKLIGYEEEIKANNILSIQINLLNRCTSRCRSCRKYTWPNDTLDINTIKNVISVLAKSYGLKTIVLSGGDPVLYPNLLDVIDICKANGIKCSMITTGITNNKEVLDVISNDLYRVHLSLDAVDREMYKYIRGVDAFDIVDKNIKAISKNRKAKNVLPIRLSSTISVMNYDKVYDLYKYARDNGCFINFYLVHTFEELYMDDFKLATFYNELRCVCKDEQINGQISNAISLLSDNYIQNLYGKRHAVKCNCYIPNISCVINANGDVYPCCRVFKDNGEYGDQIGLSYGNIVGKDEEGLKEVFDNRLKISYPIKDNEECKECGQRYYDMIEHLYKVKTGRKDILFI